MRYGPLRLRKSYLGLILVLMLGNALLSPNRYADAAGFKAWCRAAMRALDPSSWFGPGASERLGLEDREQARTLREILGRAWYRDLMTVAQLLQGAGHDPSPLASALARELGERTRPVGELREARRIVENALKDPEAAGIAGQLSDGELEVLIDTVLAASPTTAKPGDPAIVDRAFRALVQQIRPRQDKPARGDNGYYGVRWDKRNGSIRKRIEGIILDRNGDFLAYETCPAARRLDSLIDRNGRIKLRDERYLFVVTLDGDIIVAPFSPEWPHPTLIGGRNPLVRSAGEVAIRDGKIYFVHDGSGHFLPKGTTEILRREFERLPPEAFHSDFKGYLEYSTSTALIDRLSSWR